MPWIGVVAGLAAAALFGASAPVAKLLLPSAGPLVLAGLLYLGAGLGLALFGAARRGARGSREAPLGRKDLPLLAGVVVFGGVLGPALMLQGLTRVSGVAGALLLNLEAPFTILLAVLAFGEHLGVRGALAALAIIAGATLLSVQPGELSADPIGAVSLAGACLAWGLDNNLAQRLSLKDPVAVVRIKALAAGTVNLGLGLASGRDGLPPPPVIGAALLLGLMSYGVSIVLDMHALRLLGAAREAAFFATAPFVGALLAIPLLGERPGQADLAAAGLMAAGAWLLARERHSHVHTHAPLEHDHLHVHDAHHQHPHDGPVAEPHAHPHRHAPLTHDHPHVPDLHHRHRH